MGLEVVKEIVSSLASAFSWVSSLSYAFAVIGIGILLAIAIGYLAVGVVKFFRFVMHMKVKQFITMMTLLGVLLILIAIVIP
ncbi:MAG TPA: hypothetical protein EYP48_00450 [Ignisphaera sp.]|uniref:Uncharacterized protein n=1 Tax=Ignisphaera aggregans TaxID=334771 RepID=A0A833DV67_9CREN|nr:hypothetical protein [Ignisphaera sp.]HIP57160.1 hypothetical protein [Ignisphaera aggregans]